MTAIEDFYNRFVGDLITPSLTVELLKDDVKHPKLKVSFDNNMDNVYITSNTGSDVLWLTYVDNTNDMHYGSIIIDNNISTEEWDNIIFNKHRLFGKIKLNEWVESIDLLDSPNVTQVMNKITSLKTIDDINNLRHISHAEIDILSRSLRVYYYMIENDAEYNMRMIASLPKTEDKIFID